MCTISLCVITCNQEKNILRCLQSAKRFVDEIIVVDTGSTDDTKSVCKSFGAKVFDFKWKDDFSDVRNYSISKASCDWILILDSDEEVIVKDLEKLKYYLKNNHDDLFLIKIVNFHGSEIPIKEESYLFNSFRLIRNRDSIRFTGKIHENIKLNNMKFNQKINLSHFIHILHYGYMEKLLENKRNRNINILLSEKERNDNDPWIYYHLSVEYYHLNNYEKSYKLVNESINRFLENKIRPPSLAYKLKYDILISTSNYSLAYKGIDKAIMIHPEYVDLYFYKGILQYIYREYENAIKTFIHCLELGDNSLEYLVFSGSGSYLATYYLGLCYEKLNNFQEAVNMYNKSLEFYPKFKLAKDKIISLIC